MGHGAWGMEHGAESRLRIADFGFEKDKKGRSLRKERSSYEADR
jgi:hypothetical protein